MESGSVEAKGRVLLTGGSGFIAFHVLKTLLDHGFAATVTVRSDKKARNILAAVDPAVRGNVQYTIVENIAEERAFDKAVQADPPYRYVVHTASPYHFNVQDPVKDFLDPAIKGTVGILRSVREFAPNVRRVVVTSSSAAILNPLNHAKLYDETHWAPWTVDNATEARWAYPASKKLSEEAAWKFMETERPFFDLAVINNTYTFGPLQPSFKSLDNINTSNHRIRDMVLGKMKDGLEPTAPVYTFCDVRDVALAHVRAMTVKEAGGHRFYVVGGHFTNKRIADIIIENFPELRARLPEHSNEELPDDVYMFNNAKSREVLGIEYIGLERSVVETVESMLAVIDKE